MQRSAFVSAKRYPIPDIFDSDDGRDIQTQGPRQWILPHSEMNNRKELHAFPC